MEGGGEGRSSRNEYQRPLRVHRKGRVSMARPAAAAGGRGSAAAALRPIAAAKLRPLGVRGPTFVQAHLKGSTAKDSYLLQD